MGCASQKMDSRPYIEAGKVPDERSRVVVFCQLYSTVMKDGWQILKQNMANIGVTCFVRWVIYFTMMSECIVLPAKNDSDLMFCLQSYQGLIIAFAQVNCTR